MKKIQFSLHYIKKDKLNKDNLIIVKKNNISMRKSSYIYIISNY